MTPPAVLIQIFPAPRLGWAATSLPAKPEPTLAVLLLMEELERSCPRQRERPITISGPVPVTLSTPIVTPMARA
jgi:hypothetical protein